MMRYPKFRPVPWDGALIFLIISLSILFAARISGGFSAARFPGLSGDAGRTPEQWAVVYIDGVEADRVFLSSGDQSGGEAGFKASAELSGGKPEARIYQNNGYQIQAAFRPDGVQVIHADCPTQICVHTGRIAHTGQVIVCLPSRIVIRLEAGQDQNKNQTNSAEPDIILG